MTTEDVDIAAKVESITSGAMAYGALDAVGGSMTGRLLAAVRPGGKTVLYGLLGSAKIEADAVDLLFQRKVLHTCTPSIYLTLEATKSPRMWRTAAFEGEVEAVGHHQSGTCFLPGRCRIIKQIPDA